MLGEVKRGAREGRTERERGCEEGKEGERVGKDGERERGVGNERLPERRRGRDTTTGYTRPASPVGTHHHVVLPDRKVEFLRLFPPHAQLGPPRFPFDPRG